MRCTHCPAFPCHLLGASGVMALNDVSFKTDANNALASQHVTMRLLWWIGMQEERSATRGGGVEKHRCCCGDASAPSAVHHVPLGYDFFSLKYSQALLAAWASVGRTRTPPMRRRGVAAPIPVCTPVSIRSAPALPIAIAEVAIGSGMVGIPRVKPTVHLQLECDCTQLRCSFICLKKPYFPGALFSWSSASVSKTVNAAKNFLCQPEKMCCPWPIKSFVDSLESHKFIIT